MTYSEEKNNVYYFKKIKKTSMFFSFLKDCQVLCLKPNNVIISISLKLKFVGKDFNKYKLATNPVGLDTFFNPFTVS